MPVESSSPVATYIAAAIPTDSINYYVLLMTPAELHPVVGASIALSRVIENIPRRSNEPQLVQLKLNWWLEEIEMIAQNKPRHPLSTELSEKLDHRAWLDPLHDLVAHTLGDSARPVFRTKADFLTHCHHQSERQALIATTLPDCDEAMLGHARNIGVGIGITETLCTQHNSRLPREGLDGQTAANTALQLARLADEHFATSGSLSAIQRHAQSPVLLQGRLYRRLLRRLQQQNFNPDQATMRPTLLLWHAWREARNLRE